MYRLQVKCGKQWRTGLHDYTLEQAEARHIELRKVGIQSRVREVQALLGVKK